MGQIPPPPPGGKYIIQYEWAEWVYVSGGSVFLLSTAFFVNEIIGPGESILILAITGTLSGLTFGLMAFYTIWSVMGYNDD